MSKEKNSIELGSYEVEYDHTKAKLKLNISERKFGNWYQADIAFYRIVPAEESSDEKEHIISSVNAKYEDNVFKDIFKKLKRSEYGIEELLFENLAGEEHWSNIREVIRCIMLLEDKLKPLHNDWKGKYKLDY